MPELQKLIEEIRRNYPGQILNLSTVKTERAARMVLMLAKHRVKVPILMQKIAGINQQISDLVTEESQEASIRGWLKVAPRWAFEDNMRSMPTLFELAADESI